MSRVSSSRGRGKMVAPVQNHLIGLEFEKTVPLFPLLAELEMVFPTFLTQIHLAVEAAQLISLALLPYHEWGFALNGILRALHFSHIPLYDSNILGLSFTAVLAVCCAAVVVFIACAVVAIAFLLRSSDDVTNAFFGVNSIRFVRFVVYASSTILFIPLTENFLSIAFCNPEGPRELFWFPGTTCASGVGAFSLAICVFGIAILFGVAYLMNTLVFDSTPMSRHYFGRAHALLDLPTMLYKLISMVLLHYFLARDSLVYHAVWVAVSSLCLGIAYIYVPPYFRKVTTQVRVTTLFLCATYATFAACSQAPLVRNQFLSNDHSDVAIVLATLPCFAFVAWRFVALLRTSSVFVTMMHHLHEGIVPQQTTHFPRNLPELEAVFDNNTELYNELMEGAAALDGDESEEYHFTFPYVDYVNHEYDVELSTRFLIYFRKFTQLEPTKHQLTYAATIFMKGIQAYRNSSFIRLSFATFLLGHAGKPRLAMQQITAFRGMQATMSERYQGYKLFTRISSLLHLGQSTRLEALSRAKRRHREAMHHTMEFWQLLLTEEVDKNALSNATRAILSRKEEVLRIYTVLLGKNPSNLDVLACYTTFCETLLNDKEATQLCLQCLREGRELKTANTMRGAKVKGDTGTMTQIPLDFEGNEEDAQTDGVRGLSWTLFFCTLALVAVLGGFIAATIVTHNEAAREIKAVVSSGKLRGLASQCSVAAYALRSAANAGDVQLVNATSYDLLGLQQDFASLHNDLTYGSYRPKVRHQVANYRELTTVVEGTNFSTNLWTLGSIVSVALRDIAEHPTDSAYYPFVLQELHTHVSVAMNHSTGLWESSYALNQSVMQTVTGVLLGIALLIIVIACLVMFFNIHKIEAVRTDIFGLFTLIPQRSIRKLFRESRKRYSEMDVFFNLSARKKLVKLIGADQSDQEKLQLELRGDMGGQSKPESDRQSTSASDMEDSRRGSLSDSQYSVMQGGSDAASTAGVETGGRRRRGKRGAQARDDLAASKAVKKTRSKADAVFNSDAAFSNASWYSMLALMVGALIVLVLCAYGSTIPASFQSSAAQQTRILQSITQVNDGAREAIESSRGFIFTGHQRYFERYVLCHSAEQQSWHALLKELTHAQASPGTLQTAFWLEDLMLALTQYTNIAMRLAVTSYPDTATMQTSDFSSTFLASFNWPHEEALALTTIAPLWGLLDIRNGLIKGHTVDLSRTAAEQLRIAQTLVTSEAITDLRAQLADRLRTLADIDTLRNDVSTAHSTLFGITLSSFIVAFACLLISCFMAYAWTSSPVLQRTLNTVCIAVLVLALGGAFAVCLTAFVRNAQNTTESPFPEFLSDAAQARRVWTSAIEAELDYPRLFLSSGNQLWNEKYRDVYFTDFGPSVVNPVRDFLNLASFDGGEGLLADGSNVRTINGMIERVNRVKRLDEIAMVLIQSATKSASLVNIAASNVVNASYLGSVTWNFTAETDYRVVDAKYRAADRGIFYNTRASDLTLTLPAQLQLATATLYSHRSDDLMLSVRNSIATIFDRLCTTALVAQDKNVSTTKGLLIAAFALAIAAFCAAGGLALNLFLIVSDPDGSRRSEADADARSSASSASSGSPSAVETSIPFWGFAVIAAIIIAAGVILAIEIKREAEVAVRLNEATSRTWTGASALVIGQRMLAEPSYFIEGQESAKRLYRSMLESVASLYFRQRAEYFAVGQDSEQDELSFTRFSWYSLLSFFGDAAAASSSSSAVSSTSSAASASATVVAGPSIFSMNPYQCNVTKGSEYLLTVARGVGLVYDSEWTSLVQRLSFATQGDVPNVVSEMHNLYKPMILGLTLSNDRYQDFEESRTTAWKTALIALTVVALVLTVLLYFGALKAFVAFLNEEESSARLMLRIIPQEARESNKQISSYLESGRVKQSSDDLNSAIASMSTLPVIAIDQKGVVMRFSQAAEVCFGYTSSEVVGMNVTMLMPEEYAKNHDSYLSNYHRTKVKHVIDSVRRVKGRRKSGENFPIELRVIELKFAEESVFIGFAKDISSELDLAVQDQLNKYVLDMSRDPIISIDSYGILLSVNQAVTTVFGYSKDELLRENIKMLMPSEIALNHDGYLARYRETGVKTVVGNTRNVQGQRKNGEIFQASVTVREILQHGEPPLYIGFVMDVTESHEAAMQNEVNDIISDLSPVPIIAINDKGVFVKFSRAASQLFQYSKDELVGRGQNVQVLVPSKFGDHNKFLKSYLQGGVGKVVGTTRNIIAQKRDKSVFPAMLTLREIRKDSMQPVFLGYVVDITQTLQLEESGRLANEIMRFSMVPIVVTSITGIIINFNDAAESMFGYSPSEVIGKNVKILIPPAVAAVHDSIIANYVKTREKNVVGLNRVVQAMRKSGELFPADLSLREVPESEHGEGCFFAYVRDVTSHRETLQQFMINDSITQLSTIPIIAISNKGLIEAFSPAAEECFGYSASEVIGENIKMLMPLEVAEKHDEYLRRYRKTGIKTIIDSTRIVTAKRRDGSAFSMEVSVREIKKEGTQNSYVGYCRDTSKDLLLDEQRELGTTIRDLSTIPIVIISSTGIVSYVNEALCSEFQYTREEAIGMNIKILLPADIAEHHDEYLARYVARGKDAAKESTIVNQIRRLTAVRKDQTRVEVEAKVAEIRSDRSGTLQFVGFVRNLGTQLQLEQANYTIDTITNLSLIPIVAMDHRGTVIKFSNAAEKSFGYMANEVLGNNVKMLMPEEIAEKHDGFLRTYFKTHLRTVVGSSVRQEGRRKDGSRFPLELAVREIIKQGQNSLFIGYCRDASEDSALERAMQLSNLVTALCPIPIVVISRMGLIQTFNIAAADVFELPHEEAIGQDISVLMTAEDAQYHTKYLKGYAKTKIKSAIDSVKKRQAKRKSGQVFSVEISVKEIIPSSKDERQICYLGFIRDLTAVQELEQAGLVNDTIASISAVPLIVINMQGVVSRYSTSAESVFGYAASDVIGRNVKMLMPHATAEQHDGYLQAYKKRNMKGGDTETTIERVVRGRRRTGEEFPAQLTIREVRKQGQESMFVGYLRDMSSQYEIVRKKLVTEASIELCSSPIIAMSPQGIVRSFNEAAEDCFGYTKGEIVGTNIKILMPRKTADAHDQFLANYLKTGIKHVVDRNRDVMAKRKNGKRFAAVISVREVKEGDDHFFVGYVLDRSGVAALETASLVNDAIINMSACAVIAIDDVGIISRFSPAAETLFQYTAAEVIGANISMLMPEPHRSNHDNYLETYKRTNVKKVIGKTTKNLKGVRKDNTEFNLELTVSEIDIDGANRTFVAVVIDITERVQFQADGAVAKASEEMSTRALIAIDPVGTILRCNASACTLFGYTSDEVLRKNVKMLMPEEIAAQHDRYLATYRETGIKHIIDSSRKVLGRGKSGNRFEVEVHVKEVKLSNGQSIFLAYLDDVSMRKELSIAAALAESVMALIPAPLIIMSNKGIVTHFNAAAENVFEFEANQVVGRNVKLLMPPEISKRHDEFLARYFQTGEKHIIDSVRAVDGETKTGQRIPLRVSVREVKKQGNEVMFVGFLQPM